MSERKVLFPNDILAVKTAKYQHRNYLTGLLDCGYGFGIQKQKPGGLPGFLKRGMDCGKVEQWGLYGCGGNCQST